jgi:hypothetical protein
MKYQPQSLAKEIVLVPEVSGNDPATEVVHVDVVMLVMATSTVAAPFTDIEVYLLPYWALKMTPMS